MLRFFVLGFFAVASAQVFGDGSCPEVKLLIILIFFAYQGTWYEIARFPNDSEKGGKGKCTTAEYTVSSADKGKVKNSHVIDGVKSYVEGDLTLVEPAKYMLTYNLGGVSRNSYVTVLDTDYTNYAVCYSCKYFEKNNNHQVFAWILSRTKTLEGDSKTNVDNFLKDFNGIDVSKLIYNDHSEQTCKTTITKQILSFN